MRRHFVLSACLSLVCLGLLAGVASAQRSTPFDKGRVRLSLGGGSATPLGGDTSVIFVGLGAGYFIADGLEIGLDAEHYFNADPSQSSISPTARYVLSLGGVNPYVGVFYRNVFLGEPFEDLSSVGARGGIILLQGGLGFFGLGAVYEQYTSGCEENNLESCDRVYPELSFGVAF
ncbi:MAG: hypothetical protein ACE366_06710 [Bradymonadia bacterium]